MSDPSEIFRRVRKRRQAGAPPRRTDPPAPAPAPAGGLSPAVSPPRADAPARPAPGRQGGGHALYSEVMRSHDRMGTRHLGPNG